MLPVNVSLIRYNGIRDARDGVYLGGFRVDKTRSFVCGFVDRLMADKVGKAITHQPVEVGYNSKYGVYLMKTKMVPKKGKVYKPIMKNKLETVTISTHEAAFFALINNTDLVLIDDIAESPGLMAMKNTYQLDFEMDDSLVMRQVAERYENGSFDYLKALDEIDVNFTSYGDVVDPDDIYD